MDGVGSAIPVAGNVPGWPAPCCCTASGALAGADAPGRLAACCDAGSGTGAFGGADRCCGGPSRGPATVDCAAGAVPPRVTAPPCPVEPLCAGVLPCAAVLPCPTGPPCTTALPGTATVAPVGGGAAAVTGEGRTLGEVAGSAPVVLIPAPADAPPATAGGADGLGTGPANAGFLFACEYSADAGVGVPRSPGRTTGAVPGPDATLGAVASSGADVTCDAGNATKFDRTGLRPTSVAPETAVMAPGTPMCAYRAGGPFCRSFTFTAHARL